MDDNDLKKLADLIDERVNKAIKPVIQRLDDPETGLEAVNRKLSDPDSGLEAVNRKLSDPETGLKRLNERVAATFEQTTELTKDMDTVQITLESHTKVLKQVIVTDQNSRDDIKRLNKRVIILEQKSGIVTPPELQITD